MYRTDAQGLEFSSLPGTDRCCAKLDPPAPAAGAGSRRRRLWELGTHAHCPVIGVCLPIGTLRRIVDKAVGGQAVAGDYELHCGAITEAKRRTPIAECLQRELELRFALVVAQSAKQKTLEALDAWWRQAADGNDLPGALWAVLTHPRCDAELESAVLGEVHMRQHQLGAATRAEVSRLQRLTLENAALARELNAAQERGRQQVAQHVQRSDTLQREALRLRAAAIVSQSQVAALTDDLRALHESLPGLQARRDLARENAQLRERVQDLERALNRARSATVRQAPPPDAAVPAPAAKPVVEAEAASPAEPVALADCAVLCVGGRTASVPFYRRIVEARGARFAHHDGGDESHIAQLDASLAAADLVICQSGCISHDAYWRVKDHCKRTGKRCVFVENPSASGLQRALADVAA